MNNIYLVVLGICCCCSLVSFRFQYAIHLRMFSILLFITIATEILANFYFRAFGFENNYTIYNLYVLLQLLGYAAFYWNILPTPLMRKSIITTVIIFVIFWAITTFFYFGVSIWNSYVVIAGDLSIVIFSVLFLYFLITDEAHLNIRYSPEFWIVAGSIFYFSCEIPFTGMFNYVVENFNEAAIQLKIILQGLNIIMYSTFIYAFLCPILRTNTTK